MRVWTGSPIFKLDLAAWEGKAANKKRGRVSGVPSFGARMRFGDG